jgi:hypothetical protein
MKSGRQSLSAASPAKREPRASYRARRSRKFLSEPGGANSGTVVALGLLLIVGTLALYSPVRNHDFVNFDDDAYISKNPYVTSGLTLKTAGWAFTSTEESANWHPVTWLSHALDCQLFGTDPGYHHLTSLLIHILNVALLFFLLHRATGAVWPSFVVAAFFAWHPFNVESIAWVAERKNVLSPFVLPWPRGFSRSP